jgi:hypothetical protein
MICEFVSNVCMCVVAKPNCRRIKSIRYINRFRVEMFKHEMIFAPQLKLHQHILHFTYYTAHRLPVLLVAGPGGGYCQQ